MLNGVVQYRHLSRILRISDKANLQHGIFFSFLDVLLVFSEKSEVIFPFSETKKSIGGMSVSVAPGYYYYSSQGKLCCFDCEVELAMILCCSFINV